MMDRWIALTAFLAALVATYFWPGAVWALAATTLNLIHERSMEYAAGSPFADRVRQVLKTEVSSFDQRIAGLEKMVGDVKESQQQIIGAVAGRGHRP